MKDIQEVVNKVIRSYDKDYDETPILQVISVDNIDFYIHFKKNLTTVAALNTDTDRNIKLNSKKYKDIIDSLKREDVDVSIKDDRVIIKTHLRPNKSNKIVGYCRVSTKGQLEGNSIEEQSKSILERYPYAEIIEESYSAAKDRDVFNRIIESLNNGDTLVVTKLDRFCRTTKEGLQYIDLLMDKGVKIHILNMGLIEDTPMGRLIVTNLLAFAEFERAMIIERTQGGKAIAKTKDGYKEGRPKAYTPEQLDNALSMLTINGGNRSYKEVERLLGISKSTLIRENNKRKLK